MSGLCMCGLVSGRALGFVRELFSFGGVMDGPIMMLCISIGFALGFVVGFFFGGGFAA